MNPFLQKLQEQPLLGDGAMGTMLYAKGASSEQCLEQLVVTRPGWVTAVHQAYATAGADVIKSHTFGANRVRLAEYGLADHVREFNFKAVRLVRDVREVMGRALFIAGNIGPLGKRLQPLGPLSPAEAADAFHEQISVLWEAGADFLLFETFNNLDELEIAIRVAREICDLPLVASMTYAQDGLTLTGLPPQVITERLLAGGVNLVGANCSVGPAQMLDALTAMHKATPNAHFSVMPNAGFPERVEGRFYYPSSPEYFARHVPLFLAQHARLIGGCCGTTPMHIRAMREALNAHLTQQNGARVQPWETIAVKEEAPERTRDYDLEEEAAPTPLLQKLRDGKFVISVEVDPPRGFVAQKQIEGARHAKLIGADAVNVADSPTARVSMSALSLCIQIQQQVNIETVLHFTTRDRSLMGLQADLIGAHALGVRNILALTGDPPSLGDNRQSTPVYDVDSIGLVRIISKFNEGYDANEREMGQRGAFTIAVACDPTRPNLSEEVDRFHHKVSGGAHFTMTQPIYDPQLWRNFLAIYEERYGTFPVPVLIGILPLQSHRHASFLHNEVPGITLSEEALERMRGAGANGRQEGVRMAQELLLQLRELPYVQGVYLMPSFGRYELACQVLEVLPAAARAADGRNSVMYIDLPATLIALLTFFGIAAIMVLSLNLEYGLAGIPNFGQALFVSIGAYTAAWSYTHILPWLAGQSALDPCGATLGPALQLRSTIMKTLPLIGLTNFLITLVLAALIGGLVGWLASYPALRLQEEWYLALVLLVGSEIVRILVRSYDPLICGDNGISGLAQPFGWLPTPRLKAMFFALLVLTVAAGIYLYCERLTRSPFGRLLKAIREKDPVALGLGKPVARVRGQVMFIGSALAAISGVFFVVNSGFASANDYGVALTLNIWVMAVLGGLGNHRGALVGALVITVLERLTAIFAIQANALGLDWNFNYMRYILFGLILLAMLRYRRQGLWPETVRTTDAHRVLETG